MTCHYSESYVPEPRPVTTDRIIAAHYFPGWRYTDDPADKIGFGPLKAFPERTPLLGYYDEANPEVTDWEIKWAVEHGINCFIYCWYRKPESLGRPLKRSDLFLGHAIHDGLFKARYQNYMKFAIMFECEYCQPEDDRDFLDNLLPFWIDNYFRKDTYLKRPDGSPILFIYNLAHFYEGIGGEERAPEVLAKARDTLRRAGFPGLHISGMFHQHWMNLLANVRKAGFDSTFVYDWYFYSTFMAPDDYQKYLDKGDKKLDSDIVIRTQLQRIQDEMDNFPGYCMFTNSAMRDPSPWYGIWITPENIKKTITWWLEPHEWRTLLEKTKDKLDALPDGDIGKDIFIIDNWNEWCEGHYVAPSVTYGFQYLQAIREVFTKRDNLPDYRLPQSIGLGPYDRGPKQKP